MTDTTTHGTTRRIDEIIDARRHQGWLWSYTANFFIAAKGSWALTYVSHFWSLAIEEHFYLLWPLVVFTFRRETLERICLGVIGVALALRIALSLAGVSPLSISVLTPCRVDTLCIGALIATVARREGGADFLVRRSGPACSNGSVGCARDTRHETREGGRRMAWSSSVGF